MPDFAGAFVKNCDKSCDAFCIFVTMKLRETVKVAFLYSSLKIKRKLILERIKLLWAELS